MTAPPDRHRHRHPSPLHAMSRHRHLPLTPRVPDPRDCAARRRWLGLATGAGLALLGGLSACASSPAVRLYRLRDAPPVNTGPVAIASGWQWQLGSVKLPDYLDRDAIVVPVGQAGLQAHSSERWAEPLRSAVPRLLRNDLAALLGEDRLWSAPVPAGITVTRLIRLDVLALEPLPDLSAVRLRARWSIVDTTGTTPPRNEAAELQAATQGRDIDSLVTAHRLVLWRLAERLAGVPASARPA